MMRLTEHQCEVIRPLLPVPRGNVRIAKSRRPQRRALCRGQQQGALPARFGNWHTIYTRLRRWAAAGMLDRVFQALQ
jgi:transposase